MIVASGHRSQLIQSPPDPETVSSRKAGGVRFGGCFIPSVWKSRHSISFRDYVASFLCPQLSLGHTQSSGSLPFLTLCLSPPFSLVLEAGAGSGWITLDHGLIWMALKSVGLGAKPLAVNGVHKGSVGREQNLWTKESGSCQDPT